MEKKMKVLLVLGLVALLIVAAFTLMPQKDKEIAVGHEFTYSLNSSGTSYSESFVITGTYKMEYISLVDNNFNVKQTSAYTITVGNESLTDGGVDYTTFRKDTGLPIGYSLIDTVFINTQFGFKEVNVYRIINGDTTRTSWLDVETNVIYKMTVVADSTTMNAEATYILTSTNFKM